LIRGDSRRLFSREHLAAAAVFLAFLTDSPAHAADRQPQIPVLKVEKFTLPNGLEVLLLEDHTTPVVAVNVCCMLGSKNERRGRTGFAHLFEHLMFQGSEHRDHKYHAPLEKLGAEVSGTTTVDRTNYFETLGEKVVLSGKEGVAAMTAHLLREGTLSRDAMKLAGELSEIGPSLGSSGGLESSGLSLSTLTRHQAKAIELFADALLHPSFPEKDLVRIRTQRLAAILRRRDSAAGIAGHVFPKLLYGSSHSYGRAETI
jgi:predicted Zn-dependent peptidase